jgi:hypothetical protein
VPPVAVATELGTLAGTGLTSSPPPASLVKPASELPLSVMVVSTDLPLPEAALVLLLVAHKRLPHLELKNTSLQPPPATDHKSGDQFSLIRKKIKINYFHKSKA